ncbi:MAG: shikimate dehydrogenase [Legionella sp.]|nr:shikimate dehydrogenase [Legionella sp.]
MSQRFAVVGNPIDHSLSPVIHQYFAKQTKVQLTYEKIKGEDSSFEQQVSDFFAQDGKGLNITLPFKQRAFAMAAQVTERCKQAGSANTLWMSNQQLHADNTDGIGLTRDLSHHIYLPGKRVLILGSGGAARGIIYPLLENHLASLTVATRTAATAEEFQQAFPQVFCCSLDKLTGAFDLVINATSASLTDEFIALPEECLAQKPLCYDLSYKQQQATVFMHHARDLGCVAMDGLGMLVEQAAEAFFIWHGIKPAGQEVLNCLRQARICP